MEATAAARPERGSLARESLPLRRIPDHVPREPRLFSLDPVFALLKPAGFASEPAAGNLRSQGEVQALAIALGIDRQSVMRWDKAGVGVHVADAIAVRLRRHPSEFWPDWFSHSPDEESVEAFERLEVVRAKRRRHQEATRRNQERRLAATGSDSGGIAVTVGGA